MSSKVLVLGAAGRLGSVLCPFLRSANIDIISHSRKGDTDVFSNLADEIETSTLLATVMPDTIVNLAAMTNVDDCEVHPVLDPVCRSTCYEAIEHFTDAEVEGILSQILTSLVPGGVLSGYTLLEDEDGGMHLHQHEREFSNRADLARLLSPHFKNVHVLQTSMPTREDLYFFASNGPLPFEDSKNLIIKSS